MSDDESGGYIFFGPEGREFVDDLLAAVARKENGIVSEKIEPALSAEEWAIARDLDAAENVSVGRDVIGYLLDDGLHVAVHEGNAVGTIVAPAKMIALANAALSDSDPRKITRERLARIRQAANALESDYDAYAKHAAIVVHSRELLNVLESYLPPEA